MARLNVLEPLIYEIIEKSKPIAITIFIKDVDILTNLYLKQIRNKRINLDS